MAESLPPPEAPPTQPAPQETASAVAAFILGLLSVPFYLFGIVSILAVIAGVLGVEEASSRPLEHRAGRHGHWARLALVSHESCVIGGRALNRWLRVGAGYRVSSSRSMPTSTARRVRSSSQSISSRGRSPDFPLNRQGAR
jgi:hypothetical protein